MKTKLSLEVKIDLPYCIGRQKVMFSFMSMAVDSFFLTGGGLSRCF